jgi:flagella basal body P-ring formation protein FlgA
MPGLEVSAQGIALGSGAAGAVVPVLNPSSHLVVQAVVDGPDRAHVVPGSRPARRSVAAAAGSGSYYARYRAQAGDMQ